MCPTALAPSARPWPSRFGPTKIPFIFPKWAARGLVRYRIDGRHIIRKTGIWPLSLYTCSLFYTWLVQPRAEEKVCLLQVPALGWTQIVAFAGLVELNVAGWAVLRCCVAQRVVFFFTRNSWKEYDSYLICVAFDGQRSVRRFLIFLVWKSFLGTWTVGFWQRSGFCHGWKPTENSPNYWLFIIEVPLPLAF